jgi:hypothetical protein
MVLNQSCHARRTWLSINHAFFRIVAVIGMCYHHAMADFEDYRWERENILAEIEGYDPTYEILHHVSWSDYEESGWMFILRKDGQHYLLDHMYSVMADDNTPEWYPCPVSEDQAFAEMLEWEHHEDLPEPPLGRLAAF